MSRRVFVCAQIYERHLQAPLTVIRTCSGALYRPTRALGAVCECDVDATRFAYREENIGLWPDVCSAGLLSEGLSGELLRSQQLAASQRHCGALR